VAYLASASVAEMDHLVFAPKGKANGKHVVLIAGDEEYRTEESCPMLGKILSQRHGFKCTVLFSIDPQDGFINPNEQKNIPHTTALDSADLMIIGTRFRNLPDEQMAPIFRYLAAAKPVIGFRTATHAFNTKSKYGDFDWNNFGANVIGDNWVSHHGKHKVQGGRGVVVEENASHPVLKGVKDVFTPSDIYGIKRVKPDNATILMLGAVTASLDPASENIDGPKNDPMQPFVWLREYRSPKGKVGKVLGTTAGASVDFECVDLRRLIVNGAYFLTGMSVPDEADVTPIDKYQPSFYGFYKEKGFFKERNLRVSDFKLGSSAKSILESVGSK
jgi:hypothetical protein